MHFDLQGLSQVVIGDHCKALIIIGRFLCEHNPKENHLIGDFYRVHLVVVDKSVNRPLKVIVRDVAEKLTGFDTKKFARLLLESHAKA